MKLYIKKLWSPFRERVELPQGCKGTTRRQLTFHRLSNLSRSNGVSNGHGTVAKLDFFPKGISPR